MKMETRFEEFQGVFAELTLSDITSAGWSTYANWLQSWTSYIQNGLVHPPRRPGG